MVQLDRRNHQHFRILFIDLYDLWNRMLVSMERSPHQPGTGSFKAHVYLSTLVATTFLL